MFSLCETLRFQQGFQSANLCWNETLLLRYCVVKLYFISRYFWKLMQDILKPCLKICIISSSDSSFMDASRMLSKLCLNDGNFRRDVHTLIFNIIISCIKHGDNHPEISKRASRMSILLNWILCVTANEKRSISLRRVLFHGAERIKL